MMATRGQSFRTVNFPRNAKAFDLSDIPPQNLAAKREVKAAKVPDMLGYRKAGWNSSTLSENMSRFPDRAMMRQLSKYDSHKRADYNYRAEELDCHATTMYVPRPSKFQTNERSLDVDRQASPFGISRCEFPVHRALEGKPRWDPATGHGGDPYGVEKAQRAVLERERVASLEYSRRHPPKHREETLMQREERHMREIREAKAAHRAASSGPLGATATWRATEATGGDATAAFGRTGSAFSATLVPVKKQTTWSLGGF